MTLAELDATELAAQHGSGERDVRGTIEETLDAIERLDGRLGALAHVLDTSARKRADALDAARDHGFPAGPLFGVPVVLKSNLALAGIETDCGSRVLAGWRPPYSATVVERLLAAGAIPVAMAHMDEFAMGSSGENSAYSSARNPWDLARAPGGSSSGSAAAVAAGLVPLALGTDTGGSVRQPAALCGIAGFKPTYGRLSRHGVVAFASSLDQVGPLARSVRDLELALEVLSGADERDPTSLAEGPVAPEPPREDLAGLRVGVCEEHLGPGLDARVRERVEAALDVLVELGAERVPMRLPSLELALPCYYVVASAEAASNLARYDGVRHGPRVGGDGTLQGMMAATRGALLGPEVKRRILIGTFVSSHGYADEWYGRATQVRAALARDFRAAFERVDVVAGPTSPTVAFPLGARSADPLAMYLSDALTVPASLAGLPAVSVPAGFAVDDGSELPVGLQLVGRRGADARVLAVARAFERATDHVRTPPLLERTA